MQLRSLGREEPLEEGTATLCSVLAWKVPWTEEPGGLQSMRSQELDMTQQLNNNSNDYTSSVLHKIYFCQWVKIESLEKTDFDVSVDIV